MHQASMQTIIAGNTKPAINDMENQKQLTEAAQSIPSSNAEHQKQLTEAAQSIPSSNAVDGLAVATRLLAAASFALASFFCYPIKTQNYDTSAFIFIGAMVSFLLSYYLEIKQATRREMGRQIIGHTLCATGAIILIIANIIKIASYENEAHAYLWILGSISFLFGHLEETISAIRTTCTQAGALTRKLTPLFGVLGSIFFLFGSILSLKDLLYPDEAEYYYYGLMRVFLGQLHENMSRQSGLYLAGSSMYIVHAILYAIAKYQSRLSK